MNKFKNILAVGPVGPSIDREGILIHWLVYLPD